MHPKAGTDYFIKVRARGAKVSEWSSLFGFNLKGRVEGAAPSVPSGFAATSTTTGVTVTWKASAGASSYDTCVLEDASATSCVKSASGLKSPRVTHVGGMHPKAGTDYFIKVRARGAKVSEWSSLFGFNLKGRVEGAAPSVPSGFAATSTTTGVTVTWKASAGASSYDTCVLEDASATSCVKSASGLKSPRVTHVGGMHPKAGTDYFIKVRARGAKVSEWSSLFGFNLKGRVATSGNSITVPSSRKIVVTGHGYGHGIGMSQYGAQGAAKEGVKYTSILAHYYPGTELGSRSGNIRVLISQDTTDSVVVAGRTGLVFRNVTTGKTLPLPTTVGGETVTRWQIVQLTSDKKRSTLQYKTDGGYKSFKATRWEGHGQFEGPTSIALIMPDNSAVPYRGAIRSAVPSSGSTSRNTVNVLSIDNYVRGVIAAEMPSSWMPEALKAQAVAARTYGVRSITSSGYYDICSTTACQVYGGAGRETANTDAATAATSGKILQYDGKPAFTQFSSSSGGYSAQGSQPYLKAVNDPWDGWSGNANHLWRQTVSASTIEKAYPSVGTLKKLAVTKRNGHGDWGGRVTTISLVGSAKTVTISGDSARWALGLKSNWFRF